MDAWYFPLISPGLYLIFSLWARLSPPTSEHQIWEQCLACSRCSIKLLRMNKWAPSQTEMLLLKIYPFDTSTSWSQPPAYDMACKHLFISACLLGHCCLSCAPSLLGPYSSSITYFWWTLRKDCLLPYKIGIRMVPLWEWCWEIKRVNT